MAPGEFAIIDAASSFGSKLPGTVPEGSVVRVSVAGSLCGVGAYGVAPVDGDGCVEKDGEFGYEAGVSLYCGEVNAGADIRREYVSSGYVGGRQEVVLGQAGGVFTVGGGNAGKMACVVEVLRYNAGPVWYDFEVAVAAGGELEAGQGGAMAAVYDACCGAGGCTGWSNLDSNASANANANATGVVPGPAPGAGRRKVMQAAAAAPGPEPAAAQAPLAPGPETGAAVAPAPEAPVPGPEAQPGAVAPAPEAPVPSNATGYFNFCQFSGSACDVDGNLVTLDLSGMGLECGVDGLAEILRGVPTLQRLSLSYNKKLTGSLDVALGIFAETKANVTGQSPSAPWTDILVTHTGVSGTLGGPVNASTDATTTSESPACTLAVDGLAQLAFNETAVGGALEACLFDADSQLQVLLASKTGLNGPLPSTIGTAPKLRSLQVADAKLSGSVGGLPPSLGEFVASNNTLSGALPSPTTAQSLALFDVSLNQFNGSVPDSFAGHPVLRSVDVEQNQLTGLPGAWLTAPTARRSLSQGTASLPPLQTLSVSENPLGAGFPVGLSSYANLTYLEATGTSMNGTLPDLAAGAFPSLAFLHIDSNNVTGTIPDSWEDIALFSKNNTDDRFGNFSSNSFSGELPAWLAAPLPTNAAYDFAGNDFTNGCEEQFKGLNACESGAYEPAPGPTAPISPAPAPESSKGDESDDGSDSGTSAVLAVFITVVGLVIFGIAGYYGWKYYKGRKEQGSFQRCVFVNSTDRVPTRHPLAHSLTRSLAHSRSPTESVPVPITLARYMDNGSNMVQMVSNQTYNPYNPSLV